MIPLGLNGHMSLLEASCLRCEKITGNIESIILRGMLLGCRKFLGIKTRNPRDRPARLPLFDIWSNPERKVDVHIDDYPIAIHLIAFPEPLAIENTPLPPEDNRIFASYLHHLVTPNFEILENKYGLKSWAYPMINPYLFQRLLAKIAHCALVNFCGLEGFKPLLNNIILNENDSNTPYYVGGSTEPQKENDLMLHHILIEDNYEGFPEYYVVYIQLFACYGAPLYKIVAGRKVKK